MIFEKKGNGNKKTIWMICPYFPLWAMSDFFSLWEVVEHVRTSILFFSSISFFLKYHGFNACPKYIVTHSAAGVLHLYDETTLAVKQNLCLTTFEKTENLNSM